MKSRWHHLKEQAVAKRRAGTSMTVIERELGIPRSTLSGWFRGISLTQEQRSKLWQSRHDGWAKARAHAVIAHQNAKEERLQIAKSQATDTLSELDLSSPALLELALAMLYWGEGTKKAATSLGNSDPTLLRFVILVLRMNFSATNDMISCELHLRMDQNKNQLINYWAQELRLPRSCFKHVIYDKRTSGRPTYENYKGVCLVKCGGIAIQRKLISMYNLFCYKVFETYEGV